MRARGNIRALDSIMGPKHDQANPSGLHMFDFVVAKTLQTLLLHVKHCCYVDLFLVIPREQLAAGYTAKPQYDDLMATRFR